MERYGSTTGKAFAVLRRYSQDQNVKMMVLAEELTSTGHLPGLDRVARSAPPPHRRAPTSVTRRA